jgi:hypothetical protein
LNGLTSFAKGKNVGAFIPKESYNVNNQGLIDKRWTNIKRKDRPENLTLTAAVNAVPAI